LILQPLVENAIYHGIKNKRGGGTVTVRVYQQGKDKIGFAVEDDGIGMIPYKLENIRARLNGNDYDSHLEHEHGFGLENVNQRIRLYYGKEYGLAIDSAYSGGTRVTLEIPKKDVVAPA